MIGKASCAGRDMLTGGTSGAVFGLMGLDLIEPASLSLNQAA
jgi:hypothetical protein